MRTKYGERDKKEKMLSIAYERNARNTLLDGINVSETLNQTHTLDWSLMSKPLVLVRLLVARLEDFASHLSMITKLV